MFAKVVVPKVTRPNLSIPKSEFPVEEAILSGSVPALPFRLKVTVDDVALIPRTVPLSRSEDVPSVVCERKRVAYPNTPPDTPAPLVIPRDEVETQRVEVPVV
jgi:hypothetical protein